MQHQPNIVGIGGTVREGSTGELLMRAVLGRCEQKGAATRVFAGPFLASLPHYAPAASARCRPQQDLLEAVRKADGFVIASPGYHGGVSALVKNAVDLLEDTRLDNRSYLADCPVALIVCAAGAQALGTTLSALRDIVSSLRGWPLPLGMTINTMAQRPFDENGAVADQAIAELVASQAEMLMARCHQS